MKIKSIVILIATIALLAAALYFSLSGKDKTPGHSDRNFSIDADANIGRIEMLDKDQIMLTLEKRPEETWWVNHSFRANEVAVRELIATLRHLTVRLPVPLALKDSINHELENEGTRVDVFEKTHWINISPKIRLFPRLKLAKTFWVGANTPDAQSTYMRLTGSDMPFAVHVPGIEGGIGELFSASEYLWRDPVVVNLTTSQIKLVEIEFNEMGQEVFLIDNSGPDLVLIQGGQSVDPAKVDYTRLQRFLESFTELHYERLFAQSEDSLRLAETILPHFLEIKITDTQGHETKLQFYRRKAGAETNSGLATTGTADPNRFFLQVNDGGFALAQYFVFNRIMRPISHFLQNNGE